MLYCLGLSLTTIGKILHVHASTVMRWIRKYTEKNCKKPKPTGKIIIELDEMHHFIVSI
ncbi:MAG: helix-turn-helix domain-containing protein [Clostridiales bacterium]|nr:helix-turn-helix domain-containing protein [Clostridiales bacterium]